MYNNQHASLGFSSPLVWIRWRLRCCARWVVGLNQVLILFSWVPNLYIWDTFRHYMKSSFRLRPKIPRIAKQLQWWIWFFLSISQAKILLGKYNTQKNCLWRSRPVWFSVSLLVWLGWRLTCCARWVVCLVFSVSVGLTTWRLRWYARWVVGHCHSSAVTGVTRFSTLTVRLWHSRTMILSE